MSTYETLSLMIAFGVL
ncbi:MAG: putative holin-like toxin, partial [Clostridium sp.]|nr:putative holin-like toxin [Clostridium sp.]